jgi:galactokinase
MTTHATCPGRICLGGEDLDWMGGNTIQAAIGLGIAVSADLERRDDGEITLSSGWPVNAERTLRVSDLGTRNEDALDFPLMALACMRAEFGTFVGKVTVASTLPIAAGLASSAACLIATVAAVEGELKLALSKEEICQRAFETETEWLHTGAGEMDFRACALGGTRLTRYEREKMVSTITFPEFQTKLVVGDSGSQAATASSIATKRERFQAGQNSILEYQRRTDELVCEMGRYLSRHASLVDIGRCVTGCHRAIASLMSSSTTLIDDMVASALRAGSTGAKLTGGGEGGCMFAVVDHDTEPSVVHELINLGAIPYETEVSAEGVVVSDGP